MLNILKFGFVIFFKQTCQDWTYRYCSHECMIYDGASFKSPIKLKILKWNCVIQNYKNFDNENYN